MPSNTFQKVNNMTTNTKIIIGVGAIALAYYFYTKRGKGGATSTKTPPSGGGIINDFPSFPKGQPSDRQVECEKRLTEKLKTMRPDDLQKFKSEFMNNCQSQEAIKFDACIEKQANLRFKSAKAYDLEVGSCMGCKKGEVFSISSTDGKMKCQVPIYMF